MTSCCRLDKGTPLSARWLRPRVTVLFCHSPYFYSFLSFHGLTGESLDCRIKSGNDKKKNKAGNNSIIFSSVILGRNASRGSMREMSGSSSNMTSCCQLDRNTGCGTNLY